MDVLALTTADRRMLAARFREHANSHRRMAAALSEAAALDRLERLRALRRLERAFEIDLGGLCALWERRAAPETHPIEQGIIEYVTFCGCTAAETEPSLWVLLDRLRSVRDWIDEGRMVREPEA
ncbi:MAG: hypothetical protein ACRELD_10250 [Longimicrobiales bacterium]